MEEDEEDEDEDEYHYVYEDGEADREEEEEDAKERVPESQDEDKTLEEVKGVCVLSSSTFTHFPLSPLLSRHLTSQVQMQSTPPRTTDDYLRFSPISQTVIR